MQRSAIEISFLRFYDYQNATNLRICAHEFVSESFHNSENEDDMTCKNSHHMDPHEMKFLSFCS